MSKESYKEFLSYDKSTNYFLWSKDIIQLQYLVAEVLNDDSIVSAAINEDKHHKMFSFKTKECTVKLYSTTKKVIIQGTGGEILSQALSCYLESSEEINPICNNISDGVGQAGRTEVEENQNLSFATNNSTHDIDIEIIPPCDISTKTDLEAIKEEIESMKNQINQISNITAKFMLESNGNLNINTLQKANDSLQNQVKTQNTTIKELRGTIAELMSEKASLITSLRIMNQTTNPSNFHRGIFPGHPPVTVSTLPGQQQLFDSSEPEISITTQTTHESTSEGQSKKAKKIKPNKRKRKQTVQGDDTKSASHSPQDSSVTRDTSTKETTAILGDSIIKGLKWWKMSRQHTKINMKCFPGSTVEDMESYMLPTLRKNPDQIIVHIGTNDLSSNDSRHVAEQIVNLCDNVTQNYPSTRVSISSLTQRTDNPAMKHKVIETNKILRTFSTSRGWGFIDNSKIGNTMLNTSGLHLNEKGSAALAKNIMNHIYDNDNQ